MKKLNKTISTVALSALVVTSLFAGAQETKAYSGSYSFDINNVVQGKTKHNLSSKRTTTTVRAQTYNKNDKVQSEKSPFNVKIKRVEGLGFEYSVNSKADNKKHTHLLTNSPKKGKYNVIVKKTRDGWKNVPGYIKGSGSIDQ
ncbi:hypothetical protein MM221_03995 [Salipaludibacillus sp. LMS25]|jgi:hypothetical protein|uniref:hypothetical protein n=1 Tax=Salipaludibacillus sp. LMS25 TaxID=2924031 RepID=UPI0020D1AB6E|nr:hypothetical protein [Salipaludibacillus sp. LMS25]UTR15757.1 hypothetical protein MM221_03995 [Salipaludibacillus sp. LMS25]